LVEEGKEARGKEKGAGRKVPPVSSKGFIILIIFLYWRILSYLGSL